jgi:hypothetical protein
MPRGEQINAATHRLVSFSVAFIDRLMEAHESVLKGAAQLCFADPALGKMPEHDT